MNEQKRTDKKYKLASRRQMWQAFQKLEMLKSYAFDVRLDAHKAGEYDLEQDLGEMIYHIGKSTAHLRHTCKNKFRCTLESLEVYK